MRIEDTKYRQGELQRARDRRLAAAFEAGAYAAAYETRSIGDYRAQLRLLDRSGPGSGFNAAYRAAFTLGYYAAYERGEIPPRDLAAYDAALASWAGQRCVELGFVDRCFIGGPATAPEAP